MHNIMKKKILIKKIMKKKIHAECNYVSNKIQILPSLRQYSVASAFSSYKKEGLDPAKFKRSKTPEHWDSHIKGHSC